LARLVGVFRCSRCNFHTGQPGIGSDVGRFHLNCYGNRIDRPAQGGVESAVAELSVFRLPAELTAEPSDQPGGGSGDAVGGLGPGRQTDGGEPVEVRRRWRGPRPVPKWR